MPYEVIAVHGLDGGIRQVDLSDAVWEAAVRAANISGLVARRGTKRWQRERLVKLVDLPALARVETLATLMSPTPQYVTVMYHNPEYEMVRRRKR